MPQSRQWMELEFTIPYPGELCGRFYGSSAALPFVRMFYGAPSSPHDISGRRWGVRRRVDASLVCFQATRNFGDDSPNIACR